MRLALIHFTLFALFIFSFVQCRTDSATETTSNLNKTIDKKTLKANQFVQNRYYTLVANKNEGLARDSMAPKWISGGATCKIEKGDEIIFRVVKILNKNQHWIQVYFARHIQAKDKLKNSTNCIRKFSDKTQYKWIYLKNYSLPGGTTKVQALRDSFPEVQNGSFGPYHVVSLSSAGGDRNVVGNFKQPLREACKATKGGEACFSQNIYGLSAYKAAIRKLYNNAETRKQFFGKAKFADLNIEMPNIVYCKSSLTDVCLRDLKGGFACLIPNKKTNTMNCSTKASFVTGTPKDKSFQCYLNNEKLKGCIQKLKGGAACVPLHCNAKW